MNLNYLTEVERIKFKKLVGYVFLYKVYGQKPLGKIRIMGKKKHKISMTSQCLDETNQTLVNWGHVNFISNMNCVQCFHTST